MPTPIQLAKLQAAAKQTKTKQQQLQKQLAQRTDTPQAGDIYLFKYTAELHWVVLQQQGQWQFLVVPADNFPLTGSNDVQLPETALCSPLTLRCAQTITLQKNHFKQAIRVGILEDWHLQRALTKQTKIAQTMRTVAQQKVDADVDYLEWLEKLAVSKQKLQQNLSKSTITWHSIFQWFYVSKRPWQAVGVLGMFLMVLGLYVMSLIPKDLLQSIPTGKIELLVKEFPLVDGIAGHGLMPKNEIIVLNEFIAGVRNIKEKLNDKNLTTQNKIVFYALGEWTAYIWIATHNEINQQLTTPFYQHQIDKLNVLLAQAQKEAANMPDAEKINNQRIHVRLEAMKQLLQDVKKSQNEKNIAELHQKSSDLIKFVAFRSRR